MELKLLKKKLKSIQQETYKQVENDSEESESDNSAESESESDDNSIENTNEIIIDEQNAEQVESNENESDTERESDTETETETETEAEPETETEIVASEVVETEYNEDDKNADTKNEDDDNEDDILDEKDSDNKIYQIPQNERVTDKQMTHYEKVRVLGVRAKQISMGAKVMVKYDQSMSSIELAKHELNNKITPLMIKRPLPNNSYEIWKINELIINELESDGLINDLNKSFKPSYNLKI